MISVQVTYFASLILIGERIDEGIRRKKIVNPEALNSMIKERKLMFMWMTKCLKGPRGVTSTYIVSNARPYQQQVQPTQAPYWAFNQRQRPNPPQYPKVEPQKFTSLPMPMAELYAYLLEKKLVTPIFVRSRDGPPLPNFYPSKKCEHYFGAKGHTRKKCAHLRHWIQDLINNKLV